MPSLELSPDRAPFFIGPGIIKDQVRLEEAAGSTAVAALVPGTFTWEEHAVERLGQPRFKYDERNGAAYNAGKFENCGWQAASRFLPEGIKAAHDNGQRVVISGGTLSYEDLLQRLPQMAVSSRELGADGFELNLSCPNLEHDLLCENIELSQEIVARTRTAVGPDYYLIVKLSDLLTEAGNPYAGVDLQTDAVSLINALRHHQLMVSGTRTKPAGAEDIPEEYRDYSQSGPIIQYRSRQNLIAWLTTKYDIWSIGGVNDVHEILYRVQLGAFAVGAAQSFERHYDIKQVAAKITGPYVKLKQSLAAQRQLLEAENAGEARVTDSTGGKPGQSDPRR